MLYQRWLEIAQARRDELALCDLTTGRDWTFAQLAAAGETPPLHGEPLVFPRGNSAEFLLAVLRAWRSVRCRYQLSQPKPGSNRA